MNSFHKKFKLFPLFLFFHFVNIYANDSLTIKLNSTYFLLNQGQWDDSEIIAWCKLPALHIQITPFGFRIHQFKLDNEITDYSNPINLNNFKKWKNTGHRIDVHLEGAHIAKENFQLIKKGEGTYNFIKYNGNNPIVINGLVPLQDFIIKDIYPGIDQRWYITEDKVRFDFIVRPGADPNDIKLLIHGADYAINNKKNQVEIATSLGALEFRDLNIYQEIEGNRKSILGSWSKQNHFIKFSVDNYDTTVPLVIDPFVWGVYLGGSGNGLEAALGVKAREFLHIVYATGYTYTTDFPVSPGAYQIISDGNPLTADAYVTRYKVTPNPNIMNSIHLSTTYLVGSGLDAGKAIDIEQSTMRVFVGGVTTSTNFPITSQNIQNSHSSPLASFVVELDSTLSNLNYSTYLSGNGEDELNDLKYRNNQVFIAGTTTSTNFPISGNAIQNTFQGGVYDGFYACLNTTANSLLFSSYYGGSGDDYIFGLDINENINIALAGRTSSSNLNLGSQTVFNTYNNMDDGFLTVINPNTNIIEFGTYYGGNGLDEINDVRFLGDSLLFGGNTSSDDLVIVNPLIGFFQNISIFTDTLNYSKDGIIGVFNWTVPTLLYSNYFSFMSYDNSEIFVTAVDICGMHNFQFAGFLISNNPTLDEFGFTFKLSHDLSFIHTSKVFDYTYNYRDFIYDLDATWDSEAYIVGYTNDPSNLNLYNTINGSVDAFIARFTMIGSPPFNIFPTIFIGPSCNNPQINVNYNYYANYNGNIFTTSNIHYWEDLVNYGPINITIDTSDCIQVSQNAWYVTVRFIYSLDDNFTRIGYYLWSCGLSRPIFNIEPVQPVIPCNPSSITLNAVLSTSSSQQIHPVSTVWSNNSTTSSIIVSQPGTYSVFMTDLFTGCSSIDSIEVVSDTIKPSISINNLSLTNELNCTIQQIDLQAVTDTTVNFLWSNGDADNFTTVVTPGTYGIVVTNPGNNCTATAQIQITQDITPPTPSIHTASNQFELNCFNPTIAAEAEGGKFYIWNNGVQDSIINISSPGIYTVTVTGDNGCTSTTNVIFTSNFTPPPAIIISMDGNYTLTCKKNEIVLLAQQGISYQWEPPVSNTVLAYIDQSGIYTVTVTGENGCTATATITILENILPVQLNWVDTIRPTCGKFDGILSVQANSGTPPYTYQWNTTLVNTNVLNNIPNGYYWVYVIDSEGCKDTLEIDFHCKNSINNNDSILPIDIPQLITPNNDGINDTWQIPNIDNYPNNKVIIMNRWGDKIFEAQPYQNNWSGQSNYGAVISGNKVTSGVYFYIIDLGNGSPLYKGYVVLDN